MSRPTGAALRQKILEEAIGIVYQEGLDRFTMRGLAEKLGYSAATIYLYFRNKEDLIHEIARYGYERLVAATRGAFEIEDPFEAVAAMVRAYVDFGLSHPELYRLMTWDFSPEGYTEAERLRTAELWTRYRKLYGRGIESGAFRAGDPDVQAAMGWAFVHGFLQLAISGRMPPAALKDKTLTELRDALIAERIQALRP